MARIAFTGGFLLCLAFSCEGVRSKTPRIRELYDAAARREARNPVVVIPGILGSRLVQRSTGKVLWGAFTSDAIDVGTPEGVRALADLNDVEVTGPLDRLDLSVVFGVISVDVYASILRSLGVGGYTDRATVDPTTPRYAEDHFTCHTFFYDWRRDNVENAIAFGRYLKDLRRDIDRRARNRIAKLRAEKTALSRAHADELETWLERGYRFDVVAHSMGGLIARYYLRYGAQDLAAGDEPREVTWAGADEIDRLVLVGTPNLGAMQAFRRLIEGFRLAFFLPYYHPAVLGTMPALYQLLPRNQNLVRDARDRTVDVDLFDPDVWERSEWGVMNPASDEILRWLLQDVADPQERRRRARAFLREQLDRARRFHRSLDQDAQRPCPAEIRLFAADTLPTPVFVNLVPDGRGRLQPRFDRTTSTALGDGTVARYSAVADRRFGHEAATWLDSPIDWKSVTFLPDEHVGLTDNPIFTNNLLFCLLEQEPRRRE